jgi:hypothetical protein
VSTESRPGTWKHVEKKATVFETPRRIRHYHSPPMLEERQLGHEPPRRLANSALSASLSSLFQTSPDPSLVETTKRIVNGKPVPGRDNYAFSFGSRLCGGTLIHEDIVLTAARTSLLSITCCIAMTPTVLSR